ncbi:hypothetical protein J7E96_16915 [Streptomyces sp. ISL-96]|uniref:hypothetical protein n=1 Tax=Streptomyces sp. ISL-96 TaxID=2819191 RepID=UPI001BE8C32D|nr:hypothetical protein [Streptomyces sp. ISL-96]MBT2490169.1 hypothetical protein [Streptomyces sp. ISL-96]
MASSMILRGRGSSAILQDGSTLAVDEIVLTDGATHRLSGLNATATAAFTEASAAPCSTP